MEYNKVESHGTWNENHEADPSSYNGLYKDKIIVWYGDLNEHQGCKIMRSEEYRLGRICYFAKLKDVQEDIDKKNRGLQRTPITAVSIFTVWMV